LRGAVVRPDLTFLLPITDHGVPCGGISDVQIHPNSCKRFSAPNRPSLTFSPSESNPSAVGKSAPADSSPPARLRALVLRCYVYVCCPGVIDGQMGHVRWASTGMTRKSKALALHGHDTIVLVPARDTIWIVHGPHVRPATLAWARHD
jgi:hypothetical protein